MKKVLYLLCAAAFCLIFFLGVIKLQISLKIVLPTRLESNSIFLHGAIALLSIWIGVWLRIADNYVSAAT